ncbi:MAG: hypothetical protein COV45_03595 [Deltaproteobacteria bacterium CG11_big_fil_rev_8_21_14_0_20_47_16]|nr:MAG: hypothetical protein COV45_03595 [Deltaproteobacteria bacterium CG11_big_fil_rev_8_21_14_0_20_47_16]
MRFCVAGALGAFLIILSNQVVAADNADLIARSVQGEHLIMARDYGAALTLFRQLLQDYPDSPAGAFGEMALWQTRMFENRDFRFTKQYDAAENKMTALCDARLRGNRQPHSGGEGEAPPALPVEGATQAPITSGPTDWDMFVCGSGFGMKGFFDARRDKWLQGLGGAIRSMRTYKRLMWLNPNFVDAEMGVGMYEFWRSVVTQRFRWLPFFSDQRATGMAKVEKVMHDGKYVQDLARANLAYMQMEMKQYDQAIATLNVLTAKYPRNVLTRQALGEIAWFQKRYQDCYDIFAQLFAQDPELTRSLYWMATSSLMPYVKSDASGVPLAGAKIPDDIAVRAKDQLNMYLRSHPIQIWSSASHYWLGVIAEWQGDRATAIVEYEKALKLDKNGAKDIKTRLARLGA